MTLLLLLLAIVFELIAAACAFQWFELSANYNGWLALGVAAFAASFIPWPGYFRR